MAVLIIELSLVFILGVVGNLISFMVYLSPLPTFHKIYKKKSTGEYQSVPYVIALFSSMMWIYYALMKHNASMLITVNSVGCVTQFFYITVYLFYAPKNAKILTVKVLLLLNVGGFAMIVTITLLLADGPKRVEILGWFCVAISMLVFAAPLCVIRQVIRTKSIEFMPFPLSFFITLCGIVWFFYGLLMKDICIALPNIMGFVFGILQMVLYAVYRTRKAAKVEPVVPQELAECIVEVVKLNTAVCLEMDLASPKRRNLNEGKSEKEAAEVGQRITEAKLPTALKPFIPPLNM